MNDIVIQLQGISKRYHIGKNQSIYGYKTFRDFLTSALITPLRRAGKLLHGQATGAAGLDQTIWALKDISMKVKQGEVVGIIGRNGAGKSTLLKVLSRITEPTDGWAKIRGRVGSLLEVGTGFHPELTGRENIYLNGSILGMKRMEIEGKFDEIVSFAEIERFLDTPVKYYSSGMYVRLAFAVAAHLEPEVLVVDEVLAVGDAAFQKKCMGKMGNVAQQGRTVLFVSHNMMAISSLCTRALWIDGGKVAHSGDVKDTVNRYIQTTESETIIPLAERKDRVGNGSVRLTSLSVESIRKQENSSAIYSNDRLIIKIGYQSSKTLLNPRFLISIYDFTNVRLYRLDTQVTADLEDKLPSSGWISCITDPINLMPRQYFFNVAVLTGGEMADYVEYAYKFDVESVNYFGTGKLPISDSKCLLKHKWFSES